jgi:hypothetical protein
VFPEHSRSFFLLSLLHFIADVVGDGTDTVDVNGGEVAGVVVGGEQEAACGIPVRCPPLPFTRPRSCSHSCSLAGELAGGSRRDGRLVSDDMDT